ncbi:MAG: hypothetical protein PWP10_2962 [Clostridiales bacterium]|nr:hypothetical protein [Clostridiales bacterium]
MMTKRLTTWLLFCLVFYWVLLYTGFYQLFYLLVACLLLPLVALIYYIFGWAIIKFEQRLHMQVVERNDQVILEVKCHNKSICFFPYVSVFCLWQDENGEKIIKRQSFILRPRSSFTLSFKFQANHCGLYKIGAYRAALRDVFGFYYWPKYSHRYWRENRRTVTIVPALRRTTEPWAQPQNWLPTGRQLSDSLSSELDTVANVRSYRTGDALKRVHWKLSARLDEIMVKEFEDPRRKFVCFSAQPSAPSDSVLAVNLLDWQLEAAVSSMYSFIEKHRQIRWLDASSSWQFADANNSEQFELVRQSMANFSWQDYSWPEHLIMRLENNPAEYLVLVAWQLDDKISHWLEFYQSEGGRALLLLIVSEQAPNISKKNEYWQQIIDAGVQAYEIRAESLFERKDR